MESTFTREYVVRATDLNLFGQIHCGEYLRIMEETEYAYLRAHGLTIITPEPRGVIGFPRIAADLEVHGGGVTVGQRLQVALRLRRNDGKQLAYALEIRGGGRLVARGRFDVACCRFPPDGPPYAILLPPAFAARLPRIEPDRPRRRGIS